MEIMQIIGSNANYDRWLRDSVLLSLSITFYVNIQVLFCSTFVSILELFLHWKFDCQVPFVKLCLFSLWLAVDTVLRSWYWIQYFLIGFWFSGRMLCFNSSKVSKRLRFGTFTHASHIATLDQLLEKGRVSVGSDFISVRKPDLINILFLSQICWKCSMEASNVVIIINTI